MGDWSVKCDKSVPPHPDSKAQLGRRTRLVVISEDILSSILYIAQISGQQVTQL
jgi:hypothetical protein